MTTRWSVDCWNCDEGDTEDCDCGEDTCCCAVPSPRKCWVCRGKGFYVVTQLSDDNYDRAIPLD